MDPNPDPDPVGSASFCSLGSVLTMRIRIRVAKLWEIRLKIDKNHQNIKILKYKLHSCLTHINNELIQSIISYFLEHINLYGEKVFFVVAFFRSNPHLPIKDPVPDPHHCFRGCKSRPLPFGLKSLFLANHHKFPTQRENNLLTETSLALNHLSYRISIFHTKQGYNARINISHFHNVHLRGQRIVE